jgi:ferric-dicitrate binding protein FerR (iron transport regulator)
VTACLAFRPEDRPPSAAALARMLAPVASEADTVSLPADPSRRATEILAPRPARRSRRWPTRRLAAAAALVAAALAGLVVALALDGGGSPPPVSPTPHAVAPPARGTNPVEGAHNIAAWLHAHSG